MTTGENGVLNLKNLNENVYRICGNIEPRLVNRGQCSNLSSVRKGVVLKFCEVVCAKRSE
jgi:hypothetical protein